MDPQLEAVLKELIPRVVKDVRRAAKTPADSLVTAEDLEQDLWVAALEETDQLGRHAEAGNTAAVRTVLASAARRVLRKEEREQRERKALLAGYETHDEEFYSVGALKRLLPMWLDATANGGELPDSPPKGREQPGKVSGGSGTYGEYTATMVDVDRAFGSISPAKQKILERYFSYPQGSGGWTHTEISSAMGMKPHELSSRVYHALSALQRELGGQNPWNRGPTPGRGQK